MRCTKSTFLILLSLLCFIITAEETIYFEGGPALYELLYVNTDGKEKQISPENRIINWMDFYQKRGVNLFSVSPVNVEGIMICRSSALEEIGFRYIDEVGDIFPVIFREAHKRKMTVSILLDELAHIANGAVVHKEWLKPNKLTPQSMELIIDDFLVYGKKYDVPVWIREGVFGPQYQKRITEICNKRKIYYVRNFTDLESNADIFCSEDYATYPMAPETKTEDAFYLYNLSRWGSAYGRIGYSNIMFGYAWANGKKTGVSTAGGWGLKPGCQKNVAVYRAVQYSPYLYCFHSATYEESPYEDKEDAEFVKNFNYRNQLLPLLELFADKSQQENKPVGNLIIDFPNPAFDDQGMDMFENALMSSSEAITNALTSAGFQLAVTIRKPHPNAQVYYIFSAGSSPRLNMYRDISPDLLPILAQNKIPVFFQCALGLPRGPNWRKAAPILGLPTKTPLLTCNLPQRFASPIPAYCAFSFPSGLKKMPYRGYHFWVNTTEEAGKLAIYHLINDISLRDLDSKVEIAIMGKRENGKTLPLITRRHNKHFVNGNFLHLSFSNVLANMISNEPIFYSPSHIYLTRGSKLSAIFSAEDTIIDIALPQSGKIYQWHADGTPYQKSSLQWKEGRLQGGIKKWELVITAQKKSK